MFFDDYEIICIVGTLNPNIEDIPFIPLEDLIINVTMDNLHQYFQHYLDIDEIKTFKSNYFKKLFFNKSYNYFDYFKSKYFIGACGDCS